jgi:hypothetical protein
MFVFDVLQRPVVDPTLRIRRDPVTGLTNFQYLSTRYNPNLEFRMGPDDLVYMADSLLPQIQRTTYWRDSYTNVEGLAIVLRRLAFPCRWNDLVAVFGRDASAISRIFNATMTELEETWGHLLDLNPDHFNGQLQNWAAAIAGRGAPPNLNVVAFLDGTLRRTCRPHPAHLPPGFYLYHQSMFFYVYGMDDS